jgi:hypothetical protein
VPDSPAPSFELDVLDVIAKLFHYVAYTNNEHRRKNLLQLLSTDRLKHVALSSDLKSWLNILQKGGEVRA